MIAMAGLNVVYLLIPTSNHNQESPSPTQPYVVYLLIPTSNHNEKVNELGVVTLYIF